MSETGGHPIVYADWLHADGAPTAVAYAHYDVQPVDPLDEWNRPPFDPTVEGGRVYARGSSDDKSSCAILLQAAEAVLKTRGRLPINLRFVFEGEEESTSTHLEPWLAANLDRLGGDVALICDSGFFSGNLPAITIGLRGIMYAQIDVTGPSRTSIPGRTAGSSPTRPMRSPRSSPASRTRTARSRSPASTTRSCPSTRPPGPRSRRCPSTRPSTGTPWASRR